VAGLLPGAVLACLLALPGRYLATAVWLVWFDLSAGEAQLRWLLSRGLVEVQAAALPAVGLAGAVAWSRGSMASAVRGYLRLLSAEGGHLVGLLTLAGLAAGGGATLAYLVVLSLPVSSWVLSAADGYAHYATLPVGLVTVAALVELGERALPRATLAETETEAAPAPTGPVPGPGRTA
jgi:hypothetical protein